MTIPEVYRSVGDPVISSYDWVDISEGTGLVTFYGVTTGSSDNTPAGSSFALTTQVLRSATIFTSNNNAAPSTTSHSFDLAPFNLPKIVKGKGYVAGAWGHDTGTTSYIQATIQKVSNLVVTDISNTASGAILTGATAAKTFLIPLTCTQTSFAIGDNLRLKLDVVRTSGSDTRVIEITHDGLNRDSTNYVKPTTDVNVTTQLKVWIPFKIDN